MTEADYKKGTTTVGIVFEGGVVLAADRRATLGHLNMHEMPKIYKVSEFIGLTTAGAVSDAQNLLKYLKAEMELYRLDKEKEPSIDLAANLLGTIAYGGRQSFFPFLIQILIGGKNDDGSFKLFSIFADGSAIVDKYTCTGSGTELALAIIDSEWKEDMSEQETIALAAKAVNRAIRRDVFSGNGIDVAVIDASGYRSIDEKKVTALLK